MPSLAQLLARHGSLLVLDAASAATQVGLLRAGSPAVWRTGGPEAGTALFTGTEACLAEAGLGMDGIGAFIFCEGPGSMLGVRTAAMAVRTWQAVRPCPVYRYQSLDLLARELLRAGTPTPFSLIADARRDAWHCVSVGADRSVSVLQRLSAADLAAQPGELWQSSAFRAWAPPPRPVRDTPYAPAALLAALADQDILAVTDAPDSFAHEAPSYKKWSPQIHGAATPL